MSQINQKYLLEVCCFSVDDVHTASKAGAHRVELCNGYEVGGTTPSNGCLQLSKSCCNIPVHVMIRPRGGNFYYSLNEKKVILKDIESALNNKADGIVFGALNQDGTIDEAFCKEVISNCGNIPVTFHRAFDLCKNHWHAINFLTEIGVKTILTSGKEVKAYHGIELIEKIHEAANNKINILVGSGVNEENILYFAKKGITQFHSSASIIKKGNNDWDSISFNANLKNDDLSVVSHDKVAAMIEKLNSYFN